MKMRSTGIIALLLLVALALPVWAFAAEKPSLVLKITAQKEMIVKDEKGKSRTEWHEVKSLEPGDLLKYTIAYTNAGKSEARGAVIVDPVPVGTTYVSNSAEGKGAEITFSLDGKTFQVPPMLKFKVKTAGTPEQELSATPEMYSHVKWKLTKTVPAGGSGTVSFMVKVK